jgi:iron complex transport system ATP-binding protein
MIAVHELHKRYGSKAVLSGVSTCFPRHQRLADRPNGAGKTTLLMMLAVAGAEQRRHPAGRAKHRQHPIGAYARRVATLRQAVDFNLRLTVEELVVRPLSLQPRRAPRKTNKRSTRPSPSCPSAAAPGLPR